MMDPMRINGKLFLGGLGGERGFPPFHPNREVVSRGRKDQTVPTTAHTNDTTRSPQHTPLSSVLIPHSSSSWVFIPDRLPLLLRFPSDESFLPRMRRAARGPIQHMRKADALPRNERTRPKSGSAMARPTTRSKIIGFIKM